MRSHSGDPPDLSISKDCRPYRINITTMKSLSVLSKLIVVLAGTSSDAFVVKPRNAISAVCRQAYKYEDAKEHHVTFNPMEGYQSVNEQRARECAEHFGQCSVEEMEQLRESKFTSVYSVASWNDTTL